MMLSRRGLLAGTLAITALPAFAQRRPSRDWFDRAIVIDGLGGTGDPNGEEGITRLSDRAWADLLGTGVTIVRTTVLPVGNVAEPWTEFEKALDFERALIAANPERMLLVRSAADILKAKRERKHGVVLGTQDTSMVGPALDRLTEMKKRGIMTVQLTYNNANLAGDGALEPRDGGITKLGKATIDRIEAEKILLDLSHGGARTMAEAAVYAKRPMVISHTAARALTDHPRNTADATMKAVADKGGVVGVYFMPFLTADSHPGGEDLLRHVDHVANVVGEDHIGVGTDNGPLPTILDAKGKAELDKWQKERIDRGIAAPGEAIGVYPLLPDYNSVDRYRRFADDLAKRGWSQTRLEKLLGGNFLRVYRDVWGS